MKKILPYIVFASMLLTLGSCAEEHDFKYTGPTVVEFKNYYLEKQSRLGLATFQSKYPNVVPGENTTLKAITVRQPVSGVVYQDSILVQLVGAQQVSDVEIDYSVNESSTAVEGVHFDFVRNADGKVLILGNTSSGYVYINVLNGLGTSSPDRVTLSLTLVGNGNIGASENYKTFTYNIIK
jgi:hypothetical protein